jgi:hypothetical protein
MTVKELKQLLEDVPDHVEVTALKDGVYCEMTDVWHAGYVREDNESGNIKERFTISC